MSQFIKKNKGPLIVCGIVGGGIGFWVWKTVYPSVSFFIFKF